MMDKTILRQWLKAGYIEKNVFHQTEEGTPQGGIVSPSLCQYCSRWTRKRHIAIGKKKR